MSICENIQYIGNTLETNLNDRGVDCTFGIGTNEQNISDMVELITKQNLMGIGDANIQIIPNRPYVTSGETIDVTVRLLDGVGNPLPNKIIRVSDGTNSYNGITDKDGIYTLFNQTITTDTTYTVTYGTETASKTIQVIDVMIDYAVTNNKSTKWYVRSSDSPSLSVTVDKEGTTVSSTDTSTSRFYFANPQSVISDTPPITIGDFVVECDVISTTITGSQIAFLLQGLGNAFNLSSYTAPYHIKMEKIGTTVKQYINDTLIRTTTISSRTNYYMGFQLYKTCSIKFKNYRIYTI